MENEDLNTKIWLADKKEGREMPFSVPEGYFDSSLKNEIMQRISANNQPKPLAPKKHLRWYIMAAAAVAICLIASIPTYQYLQTNSNTINESEYISYVMNEVDEEFITDYVIDEYENE